MGANSRIRIPAAFFALVALAGLASCEKIDETVTNVTAASDGFPPDRSAWTALSVGDRIAHARTVQRALEAREIKVKRWQTDTASGGVLLARAVKLDETYCVGFVDRLVVGSTEKIVNDIACWGDDGWEYARAPTPQPVLAPAFTDQSKVYTIKRGGTLKSVARRTKSDLAMLRILNPGLPRNLPRGTDILLP